MKFLDLSSDKAFGYTFFLLFLILGIFLFNNHFFISIAMLLTSFLLLLLTAIKSRIVYLLNNYWKKFGELLGKYISPIVLLFIYFAVIFPTKCLLVLFRKDILLLKINKNEDSYWIKRTNIKSSMDNQF